MKTSFLALLLLTNCALAHDWHRHQDSLFSHVHVATSAQITDVAKAPETARALQTTALAPSASPTVQRFARVVSPFKPAVRYRWDANYFYVESEGMPAHPMMVGIKQWIGRFPLPQDYTGNNAWRIPLSPAPSAAPLSASNHSYAQSEWNRRKSSFSSAVKPDEATSFPRAKICSDGHLTTSCCSMPKA